MLDRASSFARDDVVALLNRDYVPVALDVWYEERRQDEAGDTYRRIVAQREGMRPGRSTQGFYIVRPDGALLRGWNNRDPEKLARYLMAAKDAVSEPRAPSTEELGAEDDARFERTPPDGGAVVEVFAKITSAQWPGPADGWIETAKREAVGRDHLWITPAEISELREGKLPEPLARRIARFHLVDNTRGEPPMWAPEEVEECSLALVPSKGTHHRLLKGIVRLATEDSARSCTAAVRAHIDFADDELHRFDFVARCAFRGEGRYTKGAPPGTFTLVIAMRLGAGGAGALVPPQGARDLHAYLDAD